MCFDAVQVALNAPARGCDLFGRDRIAPEAPFRQPDDALVNRDHLGRAVALRLDKFGAAPSDIDREEPGDGLRTAGQTGCDPEQRAPGLFSARQHLHLQPASTLDLGEEYLAIHRIADRAGRHCNDFGGSGCPNHGHPFLNRIERASHRRRLETPARLEPFTEPHDPALRCQFPERSVRRDPGDQQPKRQCPEIDARIDRPVRRHSLT